MSRPSIWKGLAAGLVGGLAGSWIMSQAYALATKAIEGEKPQESEDDPTAKVASAVLHRELRPSEKGPAKSIVHYAFGATVAAGYGVLAEYEPSITAGRGAAFGAMIWLGAHVIALPALRLSPPIWESRASSEAAEFVAHLVYGGSAELLRSGLRSLPRR